MIEPQRCNQRRRTATLCSRELLESAPRECTKRVHQEEAQRTQRDAVSKMYYLYFLSVLYLFLSLVNSFSFLKCSIYLAEKLDCLGTPAMTMRGGDKLL
jgi:hypothetical protein